MTASPAVSSASAGIRSKVAPAARQGLKGAAALGDLVLGRSGGITILIYHRVGAGSGGEMDLPVGTFDEQLRWLGRHHRLLTLDDAADELDAASDDDVEPGVVLTFDDGTQDWVDHVLPALEHHGAPATFYVATDFVERRVEFPGGGTPITWEGLATMAASPLVTVGSHTHRHRLLDRIPGAEIDEELDRSSELLRERVGVDAAHFCYPKAVAGSPAAEAAIRRRFRTAVLAGTRPNHRGVDLHRLHRSPVQRSDGARWFRRKARGGMRLEDDVRRMANRARYRGLDS